MTRARRRVCAYGHYGFGNFGDELFRDVVVSRAQELWPGAVLRVFAPGWASSVPGRPPPRGALLYGAATPFGSGARIVCAVAGAAWGQTIAFCGGSVLRSVAGVQRLHANLARLGMRDFEGLGISLGPFESRESRLAVGRFLGSFNRIVVRDKASLEIAERIAPGVAVLGGDLAALGRWPQVGRPDDRMHIGVMPCAAARIPENEYIGAVVAAVAAVAIASPMPVTVSVLSLNNRASIGDDRIAERLAAVLRLEGYPVRVVRFCDVGLGGVTALIGSMHLAFPSRLHGAVASFLMETPFAFMEYESKCAEFAEDIGLPEVLRLSTDAGSDSWVEATSAIQEGTRPTVCATDYRRRAEAAYLRGAGV